MESTECTYPVCVRSNKSGALGRRGCNVCVGSSVERAPTYHLLAIVVLYPNDYLRLYFRRNKLFPTSIL